MHVRMAPEAFTGRLILWLLAFCTLTSGCRPGAADLTASWSIEPSPPVAGTPTTVRFTLQRDARIPVTGARLRLEAHMAHPGMAPVTAEPVEQAHGTYVGRVNLTMGGDWIFVMTGELPDGSRFTEQIDVRGVREN